MLFSCFFFLSKIRFWIPARFSSRFLFSLEAAFPGDATAMLSRASFRYLSRTTVAIHFRGVPRFVKVGTFLACSSLLLYYFEAPIYFIMFNIVTSLDRAWPASSMLIHIEAD